LKIEISICKKCNNSKPIINRTHWLCHDCNQVRLNGDNWKQGKIKRYKPLKQSNGVSILTKQRKSIVAAKNKPKQAIAYFCSDGTKVTQSQIDSRRSKAYRETYPSQIQICRGCGDQAQGSAHIIPQSRCKQIHKSELIWSNENFFPGCHKCNAAIENPKGQEWKNLNNINECLEVMKKYDIELYNKFINNQ